MQVYMKIKKGCGIQLLQKYSELKMPGFVDDWLSLRSPAQLLSFSVNLRKLNVRIQSGFWSEFAGSPCFCVASSCHLNIRVYGVRLTKLAIGAIENWFSRRK